MKYKIIFVLLIICMTIPMVNARNTFDWLTVPRADQLYCALGDCLSTTYFPYNINTVEGIYEDGNNESIKTQDDHDAYNVSEAAGANPLLIMVNFTNVTSFDRIIYCVLYDGGSGHEIKIGLQEFQDGGDFYEFEYGSITDMSDYACTSIDVLDSSSHINATNVSLVFDHMDLGNMNHHFSIDYVVLQSGSIASTTNKHDSLSGRDNETNHPWALSRTDNATLVSFFLDIALINNNSLLAWFNQNNITFTNYLDAQISGIQHNQSLNTSDKVTYHQVNITYNGSVDYMMGKAFGVSGDYVTFDNFIVAPYTNCGLSLGMSSEDPDYRQWQNLYLCGELGIGTMLISGGNIADTSGKVNLGNDNWYTTGSFNATTFCFTDGTCMSTAAYEPGVIHDQPLNMTSYVTHHSVNVTWLNVTMNATIGNLTVIDQFTTPNDRWGEQETVLTLTANTIFFCTEPGEIIGVKIGTRTGYGDFLNNIKCAME